MSLLSQIIFQVSCICVAWNQGVAIDCIYIPLLNDNYNLIVIPKILSLALTSLWIIGVTNAINWMDGLDGLASGIASITSISIFLGLVPSGNLTIALATSAAMSGACLGFIFIIDFHLLF